EGYSRSPEQVAADSETEMDDENEKTDWEKAYRKLLADNPAIRQKVEKGQATREDIIAWMKSKAGGKMLAGKKTAGQNPKSKVTPKSKLPQESKDQMIKDQGLAELAEKLKQLVDAGKLSREEAGELYQAAAGSKGSGKGAEAGESSNQGVDWDKAYLELLEKDPAIRQKVENGMATREQVIQWMKREFKTGKGGGTKKNVEKNPSGKKMSLGKGAVNFYAIVVGRLRTKDFEVGEFTMQVDFVTSMYGNRWVKDELVGKVVTVSGVAGEFTDRLLQLKRGETLKVRSGSYDPNGGKPKLTFAPKFHVLERASPFKPEDYGVPPDGFRGFAGQLKGKIVEVGGYEVMLRVSEVTRTLESSRAREVGQISQKLVRISGFYGQHEKAFGDLRVGDVIEVGVAHRNPAYDEFSVTELLKKVESP
ncbi:MAG: hypothetical protein VX768_14235, partial [Planctomycetota bacterium]|nr:hypothetical protein [Planctomycetota bacterium]